MKQIRRNVFETNSSSTHSITMANSDDYSKWQKGNLYLNDGWMSSDSEYVKEKFVTLDQIVDIFKKSEYHSDNVICQDNFDKVKWEDEDYKFDSFDNYLASEYSFYTYNEYWNYYEYSFETFEETYTTPNGESVVAFGYYGYDG